MNPFFPMNEVVLSAALNQFAKVSLIMTGLVALVFTMRLVLLVLRAASSYEFASVIEDTAKYLGTIVLFPTFIKLTLSLSGSLAMKVSYIPQSDAQKQIENFVSQLFGEFASFQVLGKIGDIAINSISQAAYTIVMALLLSIAPVVIFLSIMLGLSRGIGAYILSFISLSLWPVLWNLLGQLGKELWPYLNDSPISVVSFWVVIQVLQALSPFLCVILFATLAPGQTLSKVVSIAR